MPRGSNYNAHAIYRPAWKDQNLKRHQPPVNPMDVAFLVPEAYDIKSVMLKVLVVQVGVGAVLAVVLWSFLGDVAGYSALLGGTGLRHPECVSGTTAGTTAPGSGGNGPGPGGLHRRIWKAGVDRAFVCTGLYAGKAALGGSVVCSIYCDADGDPDGSPDGPQTGIG